MFRGFDFSILWANAPFLWNGMLLTLQLTMLAVAGGLLLGVVLTLLRLSPIKPLGWMVEGYVNFLRSMPLILVIFWFYTLVPKLIGRPVSSFYSVLIAFVMFEAAYYSEIIRAGISSVRRGQNFRRHGTGADETAGDALCHPTAGSTEYDPCPADAVDCHATGHVTGLRRGFARLPHFGRHRRQPR